LDDKVIPLTMVHDVLVQIMLSLNEPATSVEPPTIDPTPSTMVKLLELMV
jgi:hypothetical protein